MVLNLGILSSEISTLLSRLSHRAWWLSLSLNCSAGNCNSTLYHHYHTLIIVTTVKLDYTLAILSLAIIFTVCLGCKPSGMLHIF